MGVTSSFLYPVAVAVSVVTTFTTPFIIRLSEPAYRWLDRIMPAHVKSLLKRYDAGTQTVNTEREWMRFLKRSLLNIALYSILLGGVVWISSSYYAPWIESKFEGFWGKLIATTTTVLVMAPLLWALALRHLSKRLFVPLWNDPRFNHGLIVTLVVLRILVALMFLMTVVAHLSTSRFGSLITFALVMLSLILFWKRIKRQFLRFEKRFFANLNEKELSTVVPYGRFAGEASASGPADRVGRQSAGRPQLRTAEPAFALWRDGRFGPAGQSPCQCSACRDRFHAGRPDFRRRYGRAVAAVRPCGRGASVAGRPRGCDNVSVFGRRALGADRHDRRPVRHDDARKLSDHRYRPQRRNLRSTAQSGPFPPLRHGMGGRRQGVDRPGDRRSRGAWGPRRCARKLRNTLRRSGRRSAVPGRIVDKLSIKRRLVLYFCV